MKICLKNADVFNEMIIRQGYSKRGLAEVARIGESTIIQITNGERNPSPRTAKRICEALEVQFDDVFEIVKSQQTVAQ